MAALALLAGAFVVGLRLSATSNTATAPVAMPSVVDQVREALAARYYRPISTKVLALPSVDEMLSALGDPYTAYLGPVDYRLLRQETAASYTGIGVNVLPGPDGLLVVSTEPGPARRRGIRAGDTIVRVSGYRATDLGVAGAMARIVGRRGTLVLLTVEHAGRLRRIAVRRGEIQAPAVRARLLSYQGRRYGYVRLAAFRAGAAQVLGQELHRLRARGAAGYVLDLRQNPGGLFDQAVAVASLFLSKGTVVSLEGAHQPREIYAATGGTTATRLPLVVLVDRYSASSAEVVAAALHDNGRATLVGQPTYGKAVVQSIDPLGNGAALELTTARYFTPAGRDISRKGVAPDIVAVDDPRTHADEALGIALAALASASS